MSCETNRINHSILRIPDYIFKHFVDCLDERLGAVLRKTSKVVKDVVDAIFNEETEPADSFAIERCEQARIIQYPRGSPELLQLISEQSN